MSTAQGRAVSEQERQVQGQRGGQETASKVDLRPPAPGLPLESGPCPGPPAPGRPRPRHRAVERPGGLSKQRRGGTAGLLRKLD